MKNTQGNKPRASVRPAQPGQNRKPAFPKVKTSLKAGPRNPPALRLFYND
ncbi:MAG: hypothetical protein HY763_00645 [Planctomycetes bacterium]|nr:hypothetical protein [Planctomycetota bacterium]